MISMPFHLSLRLFDTPVFIWIGVSALQRHITAFLEGLGMEGQKYVMEKPFCTLSQQYGVACGSEFVSAVWRSFVDLSHVKALVSIAMCAVEEVRVFVTLD